jgi:phosphoribosylglycinamide formyltransferase-1
VRLAVLISGSGTTLRNLIDQVARLQLAAEIRLVISSRPHAAGLDFARHSGIPWLVVQRSTADGSDVFSQSIFQACRDADVQLVAMGGFLQHVLIPDDFVGRVMNIHPSLIPAFCGRGLYGERVHQAALDYGVKVSGCTVHFVDDQYDHGPIILQRVVPVRDDDTARSLAARIFQQECEAYPEAIQLFAEGRLLLDGRHVRRK